MVSDGAVKKKGHLRHTMQMSERTSQIFRYVSNRSVEPNNRKEVVGHRNSHRSQIPHMQSNTQITEGVVSWEKGKDTHSNAKPFWFGATVTKALFSFCVCVYIKKKTHTHHNTTTCTPSASLSLQPFWIDLLFQIEFQCRAHPWLGSVPACVSTFSTFFHSRREKSPISHSFPDPTHSFLQLGK